MSAAVEKNRSHALELILLYSPVLIAILIMMPRLLSPQFGLLDDGKSIITSQDMARGDWGFRFDTMDSRFRPLYWMSFAFLYILIGERPFWFFLLNALALCLTTVVLISYLRRLGLNPWQVWLAGLLFVLSGTVIENFYTLSKGEWLQVMFIAISLLAATGYSVTSPQRQKVLVIAGTTLSLLCAMLSKETSVIILPVSLAWAVISLFWAKHAESNMPAWRTSYLLSSTVAVSLYFLLRSFFTVSVMSTSGYTARYAFTLSQAISSAIRWAGWLTRDFSYLVFILFLVVIILLLRKSFTQMQLALDMLIWMVAWVVVYLPWNFMTEYYMLPFSFGAAIFSGLILGEKRVWQSLFPRVLAGLAMVLLVISAINTITSARIQLAVDSINAQMMESLSKLPVGSSVYINIQSANEYTDQIRMQVADRFNRRDISVELFDPGTGLPATCLPDSCFIISPNVKNQPLMTVRMGVFEPTQEGWNNSLKNFLNENPKWVEKTIYDHSFGMLTFDLPRLFCKFVNTRAFCATPSPVIDMRDFQYGWSLYQLQ